MQASCICLRFKLSLFAVSADSWRSLPSDRAWRQNVRARPGTPSRALRSGARWPTPPRTSACTGAPVRVRSFIICILLCSAPQPASCAQVPRRAYRPVEPRSPQYSSLSASESAFDYSQSDTHMEVTENDYDI